MSEKLNFSLVSPARELFSGEVDHVIAPGSEGEFGVLPNHAPFMSTLRSGRVRIIDGDEVHRYFVHGGFADVTPEGLTILAEEAIRLEDLDHDGILDAIAEAERVRDGASDQAIRFKAEGDVQRLKAQLDALEDAHH
ncbi:MULTISPECIES: F0F1 ATP synthase subunit epsilon [Ponticaulis]|uniref:F0F1 ATP synthase subunit epsilon n=1 Tax=Ponticaulis TaxID=1123044 RepID=UPI0003B31C56|nr:MULTISPECIES: F0F1 ATP synthase subunit epsilon [Ponticaulis]RPG18232.1 MAG: F0F1 ATP synthase subunit epsilon [Hyphomonadaceae bacterium TMED125]HBH89840.1 F0F1 ATP synthase subunit epsilon [Hyphomonadaceae bacterium]MAF58525.1 F0F1 ATP synthase subunit epsilon [Ponticaulis sp.]MAJ07922.1 F0F1 ATP synthase subunit epsilon [Ponticaulis sp.]MBN02739.1 F0F1 ATP synthase subunit epsilon [Ponticaulis sp.]|tara:strand:- start:1348 stop:1758 length:411 start_codon:yes stop_codon:yes gene_type:complete